MKTMWERTWKKLFTLGLLSISATSWASDNKLTLENCHLGEIRSQVKCGTLQVPENYQKPQGRQISVNFSILPAINNSDNKVPLMFLAGGPGQGAVELSAHIFRNFNEIRKSRDIILVDQRGTGASSPLQCQDKVGINPYTSLIEDFTNEEVKDCLAQLTADDKLDLAQFTSENAVRDFDAVRAALGHEKINIYGGSYGTRAALVYMRLFPQSLNSVVLDSVAPVEVPIGLFGQSAARSFKLLLENCQKDKACQQAYPNLAQEFKNVVAKLAQSPAKVIISHPRLGTATEFIINDTKFISTLQMQLYSLTGRSLVPLIIHQASIGDFKPLAGLIAQTDTDEGMGIYIGLHLNIVCNEDMPRMSEQMLKDDAINDFAKDLSNKIMQDACAVWPTYSVSDDFYMPITANIPTLILSGELDPVTPPSNGEKSAATLPNSHHIVVKNTAHIVASTKCAVGLVNEFLSSLMPKTLDESCLSELPEESFMTGLNGSVIVTPQADKE
ncbi:MULTISPECIES: alpha/beta hydrolase [Colwellia]|uniref:Proline iminopeptidase n=1 Tax=Colwellia marinimaniae TaxID=1513592 RepID=A0ABQ0MYB7_9GAMM|nr:MULTISPECIES: alpha/beta hydrolase [Colwellia]GAW96641.1 transporter [Colwellia marinimaniae]